MSLPAVQNLPNQLSGIAIENMGDESTDVDLMTFSQSQDTTMPEGEQLGNPPNENCGKCARRIKGNERRIQCAVCLLWYHLGCTQVSVKLHNCLKESSDNVHVYCDACSVGAKALHHKVTAISREQELMKKEIHELKVTSEEIKKDFELYKNVTNIKILEIDQRPMVEELKSKMENLTKRISDNNPLDDSKIKALWDEMNKLNKMMESHNKMIQQVAWKTEHNEQYTRRENIRVFGIPEHEYENTTELVVGLANSIGVQLSMNDISVSHRLGAPRRAERGPHTPRPIIARFVRREKRDEMLRKRNKLVHTRSDELQEGEFNVYIYDDLTQSRSSIRKTLLSLPNTVRVGSVNGKVLYTYKNEQGNEKTVLIGNTIDLVYKLGWSLDRLNSLGLCVTSDDLDGEV